MFVDYERPLGRTGLSWAGLGLTGLFWSLSVFFGLFWSLLVSSLFFADAAAVSRPFSANQNDERQGSWPACDAETVKY